MLQDNFDGYWLEIKYRIIIVMFTIDENRVSEATGDLSPMGEALHVTVLSLQSFGTTHNNLHLVVSVSFHALCLKS